MRINNIHTEKIPNKINSLAKPVTYLSKLSGFRTCSKFSTENIVERGHFFGQTVLFVVSLEHSPQFYRLWKLIIN